MHVVKEQRVYLYQILSFWSCRCSIC